MFEAALEWIRKSINFLMPSWFSDKTSKKPSSTNQRPIGQKQANKESQKSKQGLFTSPSRRANTNASVEHQAVKNGGNDTGERAMKIFVLNEEDVDYKKQEEEAKERGAKKKEQINSRLTQIKPRLNMDLQARIKARMISGISARSNR
ncbi:MAG: hypothetical protein SFT68_02940 [Rickettsiaceae bacterium]|nr:hypothetical protein [Rickettsiaceae bacterium]